MAKIDFKKQLKELYSAKADKIAIVTVPPMNFLTVDGVGDPNTSQDFQDAMGILYATAYTMKFALKADQPEGYFEFVIPPLEGLWWMDPGPFDAGARDKWQWRMMIMQPDFITDKIVDNTRQTLKEKKPELTLEKLNYRRIDEGLSIQTLHMGPYDTVGLTVKKILDFAEDNAFQPHQKCHEIYLSDPRRVAPEKLKTIIRHPVQKLQ